MISTIPKHLLSIAKESDTFNKNFFTSNDSTFQLNDSVQINFGKARSRDFYKLFTSKTHTQDQTGPKRWSENLSLTKDSCSKIFKSLKNVGKDTKLKEFQFKFIHRVVVTKKELFRFGITTDDECLYCGDKDSIEHTLLNAHLLEPLSKKSYSGLIKPTLVRFVLPPRNSCSVFSLAFMKQQ